MATQDTAGVVVSYLRAQHGLRLLELPSDVLDILQTAGSPALSLKTAETSSELVLCTPDRTFDLKQVSSSNTLMLLSPHRHESEGLQPMGLVANASFSGMLELLPVGSSSEHFKPPMQLLARNLPIYSQDSDGPTPAVTEEVSRQVVWNKIPASDAEIQKAWDDLAAFEFEGLCFRPDPKTCTSLWRALVASDTDLTRPFSLHAFDYLGTDFPAALLISIFARLGSVGIEGMVRLDPSTAPSVLGGWLVQQYVEASCSDVATLLDDWRSLLPGKWQDVATTANLESLPDYPMLGVPRPGMLAASTVDSAPSAKRKSGTVRNWHDKFRKVKG